MQLSEDAAGFGCGLGMESVGHSRSQELEVADGLEELYVFHSLGASWVGFPLSSSSLCLEGHVDETMTEVTTTPQLTQTPPFLIY